jgi:hypothetical protein
MYEVGVEEEGGRLGMNGRQIVGHARDRSTTFNE